MNTKDRKHNEKKNRRTVFELYLFKQSVVPGFAYADIPNHQNLDDTQERFDVYITDIIN